MENKIRQLIEKVNKFKNAEFENEVVRRYQSKNIKLTGSDSLFEHISILVAYSQQANSARVDEVIKSKQLQAALCNFNVENAAKLNPCEVVEKHWDNIKGIRQQAKIFHIIMLARKLLSNENVSSYLLNLKIPKELNNENDLNRFWEEFNKLKKQLKNDKVPFLQETTTLLHFLMSLGYDCVKPDSAVMKAALKIGIVASKSGDKNLLVAVKTIQAFSISNGRELPPPVLDLYFLICGGQKDAQKYVDNNYYNNKRGQSPLTFNK